MTIRHFYRRSFTRSALAGAVMAALVVGMAAGSAFTAESGILIEDARLRAGPLPGRPAALYMVIKNRQDYADRLIEARSPVAGRISIHRSSIVAGVARMERLDYLAIGPNSELALEPGGYHLMLMGTDEELAQKGEAVVRLRFEKAGWIETTAVVSKIGRAR